MRTGFDAVYASNGPAPVDVACGYIGGDTPHAWANDEWKSRPERWRLPIFVRDRGGDVVTDARDAKAWAEGHGQPPGTIIALDFETRVDAGYLLAFQSNIAPYLVMVYGSASVVFANPRPNGGYWGASWNGVPNVPAGWAGHQYQSTNNYDLSVFSDSASLWDTKGAPPPPPPPPPTGQKGKRMFIFTFGTNQGTFVSDGQTFRWLSTMDGAKALGYVIAANGGHADPFHLPDLVAAGIPVDKASADAAGVPWPPG